MVAAAPVDADELGHVHDGLPVSYEIAAGLKRAITAPSEFLFWGEALRLPAAARPGPASLEKAKALN